MTEPALTNGTATSAYWSRQVADLLRELQCTSNGLSTTEARERLQQVGPNILKPRRHDTALRSFIAQVVRTRRLFYLSRPGKFLWISTLIVSLATLALPYTRFGQLFGLIPLPAWVMASLIVFTGLYVVAAEMAKKFFYKRVTF